MNSTPTIFVETEYKYLIYTAEEITLCVKFSSLASIKYAEISLIGFS